jgi:chromosome segregation ATPase
LEQESSRKQITDLEIKKQEIQSAIRAENVQREVMEARLREAERTAIQLRSEQESSLKQITDLVIKQHEAEHRLQETQNEVKLVRSNSGLELTAREGEIIRVAAELEGVRSERKNIHKMIKNLEEAKQDMEGRLTQSKGGATVLKVQNEESTKRGSEVEKDRETMTHSLSCKHELKTKREQAIRNHSPCGKAEGE